jgi:hypothetical protein
MKKNIIFILINAVILVFSINFIIDGIDLILNSSDIAIKELKDTVSYDPNLSESWKLRHYFEDAEVIKHYISTYKLQGIMYSIIGAIGVLISSIPLSIFTYKKLNK